MAENTCFQKALANFTAEFAYVGAVKHLHDLGMPPEKIREGVMKLGKLIEKKLSK